MREDIKFNKNDDEPPFSDEEKRLYIAAYKKIEEQVDVNFYDPEKSFKEIQEEVKKISFTNRKKNSKKDKFLNFFTFRSNFFTSPSYGIISGALIFTLTGIVSWQMTEIIEMNSATEVAQLNSINRMNLNVENVVRGNFVQTINLIRDDPRKEALDIQKELIYSEIESSISYMDDGSIQILIPVNEKTVNLFLKKRIELPSSDKAYLRIEKTSK
jgi:hypothetical protein